MREAPAGRNAAALAKCFELSPPPIGSRFAASIYH